MKRVAMVALVLVVFGLVVGSAIIVSGQRAFVNTPMGQLSLTGGARILQNGDVCLDVQWKWSEKVQYHGHGDTIVVTCYSPGWEMVDFQNHSRISTFAPNTIQDSGDYVNLLSTVSGSVMYAQVSPGIDGDLTLYFRHVQPTPPPDYFEVIHLRSMLYPQTDPPSSDVPHSLSGYLYDLLGGPGYLVVIPAAARIPVGK